MLAQTETSYTSPAPLGLTVFTLQQTSHLLRKHDFSLALIIQNILIEYAEDIGDSLTNNHNLVPISLDTLRIQLIIKSLSTLQTQNLAPPTINIEQLIHQWEFCYTHLRI